MKLSWRQRYQAVLMSLQPRVAKVSGYQWGILVSVALVSLITLLAIGVRSGRREELALALVAPLSGEQQAAGESMVRGAQLCVDQINREGGVHGKSLKLLRLNDRNDPERAVQQAEQLAANREVVAVLGHFSDDSSLAAGAVYQERGLAAISGSALDNRLTEENRWYFRTIFSYRSEAVFLAHYLRKILLNERVNLLVTSDAYGQAFAETFTQIFEGLDGAVTSRWKVSLSAEQDQAAWQPVLTRMVETLETELPDMVLVIARGEALADLLRALKRSRLNVPLMINYDPTVSGNFSGLPEEQEQPGFFLEGVYMPCPLLLFDAADRVVQQFKESFEERYFQSPDQLAALYYDAALLAIQALRASDRPEADTPVADIRAQIRDALAGFTSLDTALNGVTGQLYFDADGTPETPLAMGRFEQRTLLPALTQLKLAPPDQLAEQQQAGQVLLFDGKPVYRTNIIYTGIDLHEVRDLDIENLTYTLDCDLWFRYRGSVDVEDIEFLNATDPLRLDRIDPQSGFGGELVARQVSEGITYRLYRVKGKFKADFLPSLPVFFREHVLGLSFRHRSLTRHNLIYAPDSLFMTQISEQAFWEKLQQTQVLSAAYGWAIDGGEFFQSDFERISLSNPHNLKRQQFTERYSRFNAGLWIRKDDFSLRGLVAMFQKLIPASLVFSVLLLSVVVVAGLIIAAKVSRFARFSKTLFCLQALGVVLLMLSGERVSSHFLARLNGDPFYLKLLALTFDVLWWIVGALLLNVAIQRFLWAPLRKRTNRPVSRILRHSLAFTVYLLAFFGIVAFVFGRKITSLVATSGVFALILAFSNKVDISNVFAGIGISLSNPFRIGDWIKVGECEEGEVVDMTSRVTKIQTRDYSMLSIPNTLVAGSVIENYNYPDARFRLQFKLETVPVHHPERVQKILRDAVLSTDGVLQEPPPQIFFQGQGDSSAIYTVVFYINDYGKKFLYKQDVWKRVWIHLERAGIDLATPRREILLVKAAAEDLTHPLTVLRKVELFDPLPDDAKDTLSSRVRKHRVPANETIVRQGGSDKSLFVIVEGAVGLWVNSEDGEQIEVTRLGAGDVFGEMELLTGKTRGFGAIALTETLLFEIVKEDVAPFLRAHPELAERFSQKLTERQSIIATQKDLHQARQLDKGALSSQLLEKIQQFFSLKKENGWPNQPPPESPE